MRWIALLLAGSAWAADTALLEFAPPETKVLVGIEVRRILDSPLGRKLAADAGTAAKAQVGEIDFLKDVDQMVVAITGTDPNSPALLVLKGRFHQTPAARYHDVPVLVDPQHADQLLAILDDSTAITGQPALVHAAIDRRAKGRHAAPELAARMEAMADRYDIWGVGERLPPSNTAGQLDTVDGFSFGAALRQGLELTAEIHMRSAADAEKLTAFIKPMEAMLKAQGGATKFHFDTQGGTLKLAVQIPEEELKKAIEAQKAAIVGAMMGQMSVARQKLAGKIESDSKGDTVHVTLPGK